MLPGAAACCRNRSTVPSLEASQPRTATVARAGCISLLSARSMPSILNDEDKEVVKRFIPKQFNKIQAVAVAKLYIAYPDPTKWTYTGLQGAVVLANDLVGNTYWLKMVDISTADRPWRHLGPGNL
ncbi:Proline-rich protein LAS17 [Beauveria bassiana D1-5]|uniref:Proline-rich protein LAS17 n=1 Tax=Beauveria bassiana D1-5 TaxID=1245745 RepID=A0A0A2VGK0_BEABA|nr:Proline-rich protein LAS17 [Beauveria bassiana D1-5]